MYEVLRFIEHGSHCRQSMDCVEGTILIYYLRDHPEIEKEKLFRWFRQIGTSLEQYRRCRRGQSYRYLNPYSLVVSEEEKLLLMNLESPENESAVKKMQQRAVREHFVKPLFTKGAEGHQTADLFGFGRTVQFMLAYTSAVPVLTRREELRLRRIIGRCTGERGKKYEEICQAVKELPDVKNTASAGKKLNRAGMGMAVLLAAGFGLYGATVRPEKESAGEIREEQAGREQKDVSGSSAGEPEPGAQRRVSAEERQISEVQAEECAEEASGIFDSLLLSNTEEGNRTALLFGREMELTALRCLAAVYEREEMTEEALQAWERLIEIEDRKEMIEAAGLKKMRLEASGGQYAKAVLTGENVLQKVGESETVAQLTEEYRRRKEGEAYEEE